MIWGVLSWTAPAMLGGLLLLTLPIAVHLFRRVPSRRILFPSNQFVRQVAAARARWQQPRRLALLALRCLLLALLAMAFAQPVWHTPAAARLGKNQRVVAMLLLDATASMQADRAGASAYSAAIATADRLLANLRPGRDLANVLFMRQQVQPIFQQPSPNLTALRSELSASNATYQSCDVLAALSEAARQLHATGGRPQLIVLSDLQASAWEAVTRSSVMQLSLPAGTDVRVIDLSGGMRDNISIAQPRFDPPRPIRGEGGHALFRLHNRSSRKRQVDWQTLLGEAVVQSQSIELDENQQGDIAAEVPPSGSSIAGVTGRISHDSFAVDDAAYLALVPSAALNVALLSDEDVDQPGSSGFFLRRALDPEGKARRGVRVEVVPSFALDEYRIDSADLVIADYLAPLSAQRAEVLQQYVYGGGTLLIFCGDGPVQRNLMLLDQTRPDGMLPWTPGNRQRLSWRESVRFASGNWRHRLLQPFDLTAHYALANIDVRAYLQLQNSRPDADIVLRYDNGLPALATRSVGQGEVVVANFSVAAELSDLAKHGLFVAFMQHWVRTMVREDSANGPVTVGAAHVAPIILAGEETPVSVQLRFPSGLGRAVAVENQPGGPRLDIPPGTLTEPGHYQILAQDRPVGIVAVNLDEAESDARVVAADQLAALLQPGTSHRATGHSGVTDAIADLRGRPLWGYLLVLALLGLAAESALLGRWRH